MKLLILVVICSVLVDLHQSIIQRPIPKQSPRPHWIPTKDGRTEGWKRLTLKSTPKDGTRQIISDEEWPPPCVKKCNERIKNGWEKIEKVFTSNYYGYLIGTTDHTAGKMAEHTQLQNSVQPSALKKDLIVVFGNAKENVHVQTPRLWKY